MPLYEYRCTACGAAFERLVPADRADDTGCAACGAPRARRLLSVFAAPRPDGAGGGAPAGGGCCGGACGSC